MAGISTYQKCVVDMCSVFCFGYDNNAWGAKEKGRKIMNTTG